MSDTPLHIESQISEMIASRTPTDRLRMASSMFDAGKKLLESGILHEKGSLSEGQLRAQLFLKMYGDSFTRAELVRILNTLPNMQQDQDD